VTGFDLLVLMRVYETIRERERLSELRCVILFSFSVFVHLPAASYL